MLLKAASVLLSIFLLLQLSGCAKPLTVYEPVKQTYIPIPANLLNECPVPTIPEKMTFGDSVELNIRLIDSIDECNGHLRAIQAIEKNRASQ